MERRKKEAMLSFAAFLFFIVIWSILLLRFSPVDIVGAIGIQNGYFILFLVALIGGVSALTSTSFYITTATFAAGGLEPVYLALIGAVGLTLGDIVFYYLGSRGREVLHGKAKELSNRFSVWIHEKDERSVRLISYLYCAVTFLPTDILSISLALARYPLKKILLPIYLGNATLIFIISFLAR